MKIKNLFFCLASIFLLVACKQEPEIKFDKPKKQVLKKPQKIEKKKGSLYSVRGPSLFADKKDLQIGDIIQVRISESLSSNTNTKRELSANRNSSLGGGAVSQMNASIPLSSPTQKISDKINAYTGINFQTKSNSSNNGEVKTKLSENFSTKVSAIIEDVYANGNYYIKGFKEILIDGQKQSLTLSGVIRPYDISSDNAISSSQIANLKILYKKDGEEQNVMHTPWGLKVIKMFWPF